MSVTTTQRRKATNRPDATVLVDPNEETPVATGAAADPHVVATVHRKYCGTGPFDHHWLNVECCGLFSSFLTYCLHTYGVYAVCWILLPPWMSYTDEQGRRSLTMAGMFHSAAFLAIAVMAVISHYKCMTTDPGAVPPDATPVGDEDTEKKESVTEPEGNVLATVPKIRRLCRRCKAYKPPRAHHCSVCGRCIIKMDHHCPWVNNCVGIGNHKYFLLFIFYTALSCIYSMILVVTRFSTCMGSYRYNKYHHDPHEHRVACLDHPTQLLNVLGLIIESLLFGMFTSCMMIDQSGVISSGLTHIDRLKGTSVGGALAGVVEVFGVGRRGNADTKFRLDWLSPFVKTCFPPSCVDEVMGFCRATKSKDTELTPLNGARKASDIV